MYWLPQLTFPCQAGRGGKSYDCSGPYLHPSADLLGAFKYNLLIEILRLLLINQLNTNKTQTSVKPKK